MDSSLPLEELLKFKGKDAEKIAKLMRKRDISLKNSIEQLAQEALDYYETRYEKYEGPQALAHLGLLFVEIGNYRKGIGDPYAIFDYKEAWHIFTDPLNRGHDVDADELVRSVPELKVFAEVQARYK